MFLNFSFDLEVALRKRFRLTVDLAVEVREEVEKGELRMKHIQALLTEFLKDEKAVLLFYRIYLNDDLRVGGLGEQISKWLKKVPVEEILAPVIERCSKQVRDNFSPEKEKKKRFRPNGETDHDILLGQLELFNVEGVTFEMVGKGNENG